MSKDLPVRIVSLHLYPLKSCHRIDVSEATLGPRGFAGDREWMVADATGRFLTQRTHPALATIRPAYERDALVLHHPGLAPLTLPRAGEADWSRRRVRIWNDAVEVAVTGPEACRWISAAAGVEALLVRSKDYTARQPAGPWRGDAPAPVNFPDAYPLLVCGTASLQDLNQRLPRPVPMTRFRPNLVIEGLAPFEEDGIAALQFGASSLRLVKACTRCSTTTIDQDTGTAADNPLEVLKTYRFDRELRGVTFGQNALIAAGEGAVLRVGDRGMARQRRGASGAAPMPESDA